MSKLRAFQTGFLTMTMNLLSWNGFHSHQIPIQSSTCVMWWSGTVCASWVSLAEMDLILSSLGAQRATPTCSSDFLGASFRTKRVALKEERLEVSLLRQLELHSGPLEDWFSKAGYEHNKSTLSCFKPYLEFRGFDETSTSCITRGPAFVWKSHRCTVLRCISLLSFPQWPEEIWSFVWTGLNLHSGYLCLLGSSPCLSRQAPVYYARPVLISLLTALASFTKD